VTGPSPEEPRWFRWQRLFILVAHIGLTDRSSGDTWSCPCLTTHSDINTHIITQSYQLVSIYSCMPTARGRRNLNHASPVFIMNVRATSCQCNHPYGDCLIDPLRHCHDSSIYTMCIYALSLGQVGLQS
jgi:hypothetical protein